LKNKIKVKVKVKKIKMPSMGKVSQIALVATVLFAVFSYTYTYSMTNKVFGSMVGQDDQPSYGSGFTYKNYGYLIHLVVFGVVLYLILKRVMMKGM